MKCPNCGNDLIPGALFCASCGNKIPEELLNATTTQGASEPVTTPTEETPVATAEAPTVTQETHVAGAPQPAAPTMEQQMPYQNAAASQIPTGTPVMPGMETDTDKKKKTTRIIGVAAVAVVVAAVGFVGFKVVNAMHPHLDKQLLYCKDGRLYYVDNVSKEKEPVEIYQAHSDDNSFSIQYTKDQKYAFFLTGSDDKQRLYRVNTQKLTSNESKNEKYIEEIDSGVTDYTVIDSDKVLYNRGSNNDYGYELNYYDGKDTKEIDSDVVSDYVRRGDIIYYQRDTSSDDDNYDTCYYNLKNGKHGDIDECYDLIDCNESEVLYVVEDEDSYDIYKAKLGGKATKIVSEVSNDYYDGSLSEGTIYYTKKRTESKSYYDYVNDPYASQDASATEPKMEDYMSEVKAKDILDDYRYEEYKEDRNDFYYYYVSDYNSIYCMGTDLYPYYGNDGTYYVDESNDKFYSFDQDAYDDAYNDYYDIENRNELRDSLKNETYDSTFYDMYLYTSKGGEKKIAESVIPVQEDPIHQIFFYRKAQDLDEEKVCSLDDVDYASDVESYINSSSSDDLAIYAYINGKEQDMKMDSGYFTVSSDGKTVMVVDDYDDDNVELIAYNKKGDSLEKIGTVEKNFESGSWCDDDYYYFDDNNDFYIYSNGKSKKIAKDVAYAELEEDGNYLTYDTGSSEGMDAKILKGDEQVGKIRDVSPTGDGDGIATYIDSNCIVYLTYDGDLNVYDGEDSREIDRDVIYYRSSAHSTIGYFYN